MPTDRPRHAALFVLPPLTALLWGALEFVALARSRWAGRGPRA